MAEIQSIQTFHTVFLHRRNSFTPTLFHLYSSSYSPKTDCKNVNIFHSNIYHLTTSLSARCKTYCFAFQKRLFCAAKPTLLPCKTAAFAMPKRSYHFLRLFSLQNQSYLQHLPQVIKRKTISQL